MICTWTTLHAIRQKVVIDVFGEIYRTESLQERDLSNWVNTFLQHGISNAIECDRMRSGLAADILVTHGQSVQEPQFEIGK